MIHIDEGILDRSLNISIYDMNCFKPFNFAKLLKNINTQIRVIKTICVIKVYVKLLK